jgi:hypothetical protein
LRPSAAGCWQPLRDCLRGALRAQEAVAGIRPRVSEVSNQSAGRSWSAEQWFITQDTHQRTRFVLTAIDAQRTRVEVDLLQTGGQYDRGGYAQAARALVATCASGDR